MGYRLYVYQNGERIHNELVKRLSSKKYTIYDPLFNLNCDYINNDIWILALDYELTLNALCKKLVKPSNLLNDPYIDYINPCKYYKSGKYNIILYHEDTDDAIYWSKEVFPEGEFDIVLLCNCYYPKQIYNEITVYPNHVYMLVYKKRRKILNKLLELDKKLCK